MTTVSPIDQACLVVLVGPPASGKSEWARRNGAGAVIVSQDDLIDAITPHGFAPCYRDVYTAAENASATAALAAGFPVIVDRTNRTRCLRARWTRIARESGCLAFAIEMKADADICRARNNARTGHRHVCETRMERMLAAMEPVAPDEGFASVFQADETTLPDVFVALRSALERKSMSIATKRGDDGTTALVGGTRISKGHPRVECYGTIDELVSQIGFARSICADAEIGTRIREIQRELFTVAAAIATPRESRKIGPLVTEDMILSLDADVLRIENMPGLLGDWSLPGELPDAAALDVARTVCRRTERLATALFENGEISDVRILAYLNRLSDVLWLFGRQLEARAGADSSLRPKENGGPRWSRPW